MKCVICHGEEIQLKQVHEEFGVGSDIVRVPIQTPVCSNCGERYYDRKTIRHLEQIRQGIEGKKVHLREIGKVLACEG